MERFRPFSVYHMFSCSAKSTHFVSNFETIYENAVLGKYPYIISILHRGDFPNLLQYYNRGGGVCRYPKFVLRNRWTAPYDHAADHMMII